MDKTLSLLAPAATATATAATTTAAAGACPVAPVGSG
jgi:hypothetical protein